MSLPVESWEAFIESSTAKAHAESKRIADAARQKINRSIGQRWRWIKWARQQDEIERIFNRGVDK